MKSYSSLPIISSPRSQKPVKTNSDSHLLVEERDTEKDYLFRPKNRLNLKIAPLKPIRSSRIAESRIEFFENLHRLPELKKRAPEEQTVSIAYLTECHKKGLNPIPLGLAYEIGSSVDIRNFGIGDNYAKAFSKGIKRIKSLEKLNVGSNSLSPRGMKSIITNIALQPLKELNLKDNQINAITLKPLIGLISKQNPSLKYLNLENTKITDVDVVRLCEVISNDRVLNFLGLAINSLGYVAAGAIKNMLNENHYLKKLDLHWNNIKDVGAVLIFEGLARNESLKELDLSWNSIGKNLDLSNIAKISEFLPKIQGLAHLDLSFNYLTSNECILLAEGLKENHYILGLHLLGNEGFIDSQGFLISSSKNHHFEQGHLFRRIFSESKSGKKKSVSHSKCWICEKWVEMTFFFNAIASGGSNTGQVFIHLDCDEYEPDLMTLSQDVYKISRVVPPGDINFFFSKSNYPMRSKDYDLQELKTPIEKNVHFSKDFEVPIIMHVINKAPVQGKNFDYKNLFETLPRKKKFFFAENKEKPTRLIWDISVSLFKDYRILDEKLVSECLEFDWNQSKLPNLVKQSEQNELKSLLSKNYYQIIETFRYLASQSGNEYVTIGSNVFTDFLNQCKIFDSLYDSSDLGVNWNAVIVPKDKKQQYNPGNSLVRYEFTEILVRIANDRYVRNKICGSVTEAFSMLLQENLDKQISIQDSNKWRTTEYMCEEVDVVLKSHKPILDVIYKTYSGKKSLPGQKAFMSIEEFRKLCYDSKLVSDKTPSRDIDAYFYIAIMVQVDELNEKKHIEMGFVEFLEALCRICRNLDTRDNFSESLELSFNQENIELTKKIEKAMWNLYQLCPKQFQDNFVFPTQQTYKMFMYKLEKKPTSLRSIYNDI